MKLLLVMSVLSSVVLPSTHLALECEEADYGWEVTDNILADIEEVGDASECRNICSSVVGCSFYTWRESSLRCLALSSCSSIDEMCEDCITGRRCDDGRGIALRIDPDSYDVSIDVNDTQWFINNDVIFHQNNKKMSLLDNTLVLDSSNISSGNDTIGKFVKMSQIWSNDEMTFHTSVRGYGDAIVFSQEFTGGLENTSLAMEEAQNHISTAYPSLVTNSGQNLSYLSYGGFMAGWAAISVSSWDGNTKPVRDGEYGGPLVLFDKILGNVAIMSPLNNFMVSSLYHCTDPESFQWGLMATVEEIPKDEKLETIVVYGASLREAFSVWGNILRSYHDKSVDNTHDDVGSNYLGYWMDNGAFYYYNTLPDMNYEETVLAIKTNLSSRVPVGYVNYDSWWYLKGNDLGVKSWTAKEEIFPSGLESLYEATGWPVAAHNRYWATDNVYSTDNGGQYHFVTEQDSKRALPLDPEFWIDFFNSTSSWGLSVYEQDWQDRQFVQMGITHTDFTAGRDWLRQMGEGAGNGGVTVQYCMSLPREVLQSSEVPSVRRVRVSGDYILSKDNWKIGITTLMTASLGLASFKNVFWSSQRNPGNKFYYNCMEVSNNTDPNIPWTLEFRYTGYQNLTKSGHSCLSWYELEWHWKYPLNDLERDGCRSLPGSEYAGGKPFCFYEGNVDTPLEDWKWEECNIPVCEETCNRPGFGQNMSLPNCKEYVEDNPELQAAVSLFSGGGVGVGDNLEFLDDHLVRSTCRDDGRLLGIGNPLMVSPLQLQRMASLCHPSVPHSCAGEIWSGFSIIAQHYFGVILVAENPLYEEVGLSMLGSESLSYNICHLSYTRDLSQTYLLGDCGRQGVSLPQQSHNIFMILYTSSVMEMREGVVKVVLLGELNKIGVISPSRIKDMEVGGDNITISLDGSNDERVNMSWMIWTEDFYERQFANTECILGEGQEAKMVVTVMDDNGKIVVDCT